MLKNTADSYGLVARILHWLMALLIIGLIIVGLIMEELPEGDLQSQIVSLHKATGGVVLILLIIRLAWKAFNPQPEIIAPSPMQKRIAKIAHWTLYGLVALQAVSGVLMSQAKGYAVSIFGLFDLPTLVDENEGLAEIVYEIHHLSWIALSVVIAIHAAAAVKHHFIDKDRTLIRMLRG